MWISLLAGVMLLVAEKTVPAGGVAQIREVVLTVEDALPATGLPRIAALQRVDGDLVIHSGGLRRAPAEVLESTDYLLRVAVPEGPLDNVRIELGAWFDEWRLHVD